MKNALIIISLLLTIFSCGQVKKNEIIAKKTSDKIQIQDDSIFINYDNTSIIGYLKPDFWKDATTYRRDSLYKKKENSFFFDDIYYEKQTTIHSYDFRLVNEKLFLKKVIIKSHKYDILEGYSIEMEYDTLIVNDFYNKINPQELMWQFTYGENP